jgi:hypothetical protein
MDFGYGRAVDSGLLFSTWRQRPTGEKRPGSKHIRLGKDASVGLAPAQVFRPDEGSPVPPTLQRFSNETDTETQPPPLNDPPAII